jgi:flagellar brake protein
MGMTTPFPEPDSPELQRFVVDLPAEVVGHLRALQGRAVPLNAFFNAGAGFNVAALLEVDEAASALVLESPPDAATRAGMLAAPVVTFVGFVDTVKLQFSASGALAATHAGRPALTVPMPATLLQLDRRSAARVRPESGRGGVCRIPLVGRTGEHEALRVLDIGAGGLAVLAYPEQFDLAVGSEIEGCRLDLMGVGGAEVTLRVRHVGRVPGDDRARCCRCEFVRMPPAVQGMLERHFKQFGESSGRLMGSGWSKVLGGRASFRPVTLPCAGVTETRA